MPEGCDQRLCEDFEGGAAGGIAEEAGYKNKGQEEICASGPLGIDDRVCRGTTLEAQESSSTHD